MSAALALSNAASQPCCAEEIRVFEAQDAAESPPGGGVLFIGSSSIRMWESLQRDFPAHNIVRRGFGGSQMSDVLAYADRIVFPYAPRMIFLYEGDNDLAGGDAPESVFAEYRAFVGLVRDRLPETRVAYIAAKPSLARRHLLEQYESLNRLVRAHAAHDPLLEFVDVYTPMLAPDGTPRADIFIEDGLHMNAAGYAIWREAVAPYLPDDTGD